MDFIRTYSYFVADTDAVAVDIIIERIAMCLQVERKKLVKTLKKGFLCAFQGGDRR